jgi:hypothetical protein
LADETDVLGDPYIQSWKYLAALTEDFDIEEFLFDRYYICGGVRRVRRSLRHNGRSSLASRSG